MTEKQLIGNAVFHDFFIPVQIHSARLAKLTRKPSTGDSDDQCIPQCRFYPAEFAAYIALGSIVMDSADRDRKKAWKAQQKAQARGAFPVPDEVLDALFRAVEADVEEHGCDHSLRFTERWIADNKQKREPMLAWLKDNGGFCDCEVAANTYEHWEQNR
jgi:hypothetical protein